MINVEGHAAHCRMAREIIINLSVRVQVYPPQNAIQCYYYVRFIDDTEAKNIPKRVQVTSLKKTPPPLKRAVCSSILKKALPPLEIDVPGVWVNVVLFLLQAYPGTNAVGVHSSNY